MFLRNTVFLCGRPAKYEGRKRDYDVIPVRTKDFQDKIQEACKVKNDEWAETVWGRLEFAQDLHAADAVYHYGCSVNFRMLKQIPKKHGNDTDSKRVKGRPMDTVKSKAFLKVTEVLVENDEEQFTIPDLIGKMQEYLEGTGEPPYSAVYMKEKLQEHFGEKIVIITVPPDTDTCAYKGPSADNVQLLYKELRDLKVTDATANLDLLCKISLPLFLSPRPGWSGTMQRVCDGQYPGKSSVLFLPMIDLDPTDMTCVYSTLLFVSKQAKRYGFTPILTFDQPLRWKALNIIQNERSGSDLKSIVLRLGGFHIQMSFLGCIGHLMAGSGLQELLELVYAKNAVIHMLSGKAVSRAIRGYFLVDGALNTMLASNTFNVPLPVKSTKEHGTVKGEEVSPACSTHTDIGLTLQSATIVQV